MTKVDASLKRRLTARWQAAFADFDVWRPLRLLRRMGPILQGVALDFASTGNEYYPTAHIHPLTKRFPVVSLSLGHRLVGSTGVQRRLRVDESDTAIVAAAESLRRQAPLPLDRIPTLVETLEVYRAHITSDPGARFGPTPEMEDIILLSGYGEDAKLLSSQTEVVARIAKSWRVPPEGYPTSGAWIEYFTSIASDRNALDAIVFEQVHSLKVDKVTNTGLIVGLEG